MKMKEMEMVKIEDSLSELPAEEKTEEKLLAFRETQKTDVPTSAFQSELYSLGASSQS